MTTPLPPKFHEGEEAIFWPSPGCTFFRERGRTCVVVRAEYAAAGCWVDAETGKDLPPGWGYMLDFIEADYHGYYVDGEELRKKPQPCELTFDELMRGLTNPQAVKP